MIRETAISANKTILWIVIGGLAIRLISFPFLHLYQYTSDEREYVSLGAKVAHTGEFIDSNGEYSTRSPLFPLLLGALFGFVGESLTIPLVLGCMVGAAGIWLGMLLCVHVHGDITASVIAGVAMALYPGLVVYSGLLQTEALYILFFLIALVFAYRFLQAPSWINMVVLGITSGLAALTRAVFLGFFPLLLLAIVWMRRRGGQKSLWPVAVVAVIFLVVLLPWTLRNYKIHGEPILVTSGVGRLFLIGNNPYASGTWSLKEGFDGWFRQKASEHGIPDVESLNELQKSELCRKVAFEYIVSNPFHAVQLAVKKAHMFLVYPITHTDSYVWLQMVSVASDFTLLLGAAVGFVATWVRRDRFLPLYLAFLYFSVLHIVLHAEARFRLPLIPLVCFFFGCGAVALGNKQWRTELRMDGNAKRIVAGLVATIVIVYSFTGWIFLEGRI